LGIEFPFGQNGRHQQQGLRDGQGRGFFFMASMVRTTKKCARVTKVI
jgi:hypothetical protein